MSDEDRSDSAPRDEREQLHERIQELKAEGEAARGEIAEIKDKVAELTAKRDARIKAIAQQRRRRRVIIASLTMPLVIGVIVGGVLYVTHVEEETLRGRVVAVEGNAPAEVDDTCIVSIESASFPFNTHISVVCGGRRLYGYDSFGYVHCETEESRLTRCEDGGSIREDGDPFLVINRNNHTLMLEDGRRWKIRIELLEPDSPGTAPQPPG